MFDHKLLATEGLFPGRFSTLACATVGAFTFEIEIQPVVAGGGGGYYPPSAVKDKYTITIRVTAKNGKVWKYQRTVSNLTARVVARLTGIQLKKEQIPQIVVHHVSSQQFPEQEPNIKVSMK